jgi:hypothetical protein
VKSENHWNGNPLKALMGWLLALLAALVVAGCQDAALLAPAPQSAWTTSQPSMRFESCERLRACSSRSTR